MNSENHEVGCYHLLLRIFFKLITLNMILNTESKIYTNNVIIQFSDIKYSGENTQKIEFILLTPFIPKNGKEVYSL